MPVKKVTTRKSAVKKDAPATKRTKKPELKEFLKEVEKKAYERYQEFPVTRSPIGSRPKKQLKRNINYSFLLFP
jgi:hypothetical protein